MKIVTTINKTVFYSVLIIFIVLFSRFLVSENYIYGYDSVNYALGVENFSLENTRPHLPGSILFVKSIELINLALGNIHLSFLLLLQLFSVIASLISFKIFLKYFDLKKSFLLVIFLIFNPMVWFYGAVTEIYVFDWLFVSLVLYISLHKNAIYLLPSLFALASGFRPSSGLLLLPFYFYMLWTSDIEWGKLVKSLSIALFLFLCWFIPLVLNAGGILEYIELFRTNNPMEQISLAQNIFRLSSLMFYLVIPILVVSVFFKKHNFSLKNSTIKRILFLIIPPILFFVFSHYSKGYALIIMTPLVLLVGVLIGNKYKLVISIAVLVEIIMFTIIPAKAISIESKIKPTLRENGIINLWIDRTFSDYSLTMNQINSRDMEISVLIEVIEKHDGARIHLGPMLSHLGRALQIYFPTKEINSISFRDSNEVISFSEQNVIIKKVTEVSENDILILRKDCFEKYFSSFKAQTNSDKIVTIILSEKIYNSFQTIVDSIYVR